MKWNEGVLIQLRGLAELGNTAAQYRLGDYYASWDLAKAIDWYRKAAESGFALAQVVLGDMYAKGRGVERNSAIAADWYHKAIQQGDGRAVLALLRTPPSAMPPQILDAVVVSCRKAASDGDTDALCWLGTAHEQGIGVEKDPGLAARLYHKAAALGHSQARLLLRAIAAHDTVAATLAASLDQYTLPGQEPDQGSLQRQEKDEEGFLDELRGLFRAFAALLGWILGILGGVLLVGMIVYLVVRFVHWAWTTPVGTP